MRLDCVRDMEPQSELIVAVPRRPVLVSKGGKHLGFLTRMLTANMGKRIETLWDGYVV